MSNTNTAEWAWLNVQLPGIPTQSYSIVANDNVYFFVFHNYEDGINDNKNFLSVLTLSSLDGIPSMWRTISIASERSPLAMLLGAVIVDGKPAILLVDKANVAWTCSLESAPNDWRWQELIKVNATIVKPMGSIVAGGKVNVFFLDEEGALWTYFSTSEGWKAGKLSSDEDAVGEITASMGTIAVKDTPNVLVLNKIGALWTCFLPEGEGWKWAELPELPSDNIIETPMGTAQSSDKSFDPYMVANILALDQKKALYTCQIPKNTNWKWQSLPAMPSNAGTIQPIKVGTAVINGEANVFVKSTADILWACQATKPDEWRWIQLPSIPDGQSIGRPLGIATDGSATFIFLQESTSLALWYCFKSN